MPPSRFAPTPFETTVKSSRHNRPQPHEEPSKPKRFAPQVVETSRKSSKDRTKERPSRIRFSPQPLETSHASNRQSQTQDEEPTSPGASNPASGKQPARKFQPVLIDTAQRSRRSTESKDSDAQDFKTESGHHLHAHEHRRHMNGSKTPTGNAGSSNGADPSKHSWIPTEQRRPMSPLDGSRGITPGIAPERQHSFRCPDLDTIESSESERGSSPDSRSPSPNQGSPITASDTSYTDIFKHATRIRESVDENFSQYLLQLEAKKAQQRLREQALAAYPNSDFHEPVQHYVNTDDDSDEMEVEDRPVTWEGFDEDEILDRFVRHRRESTKTPWEQMEMQRHAEKAEEERRANQTTTKPATQSSSPWWNPTAGHTVYQQDQDHEMRSMRDRARPPMLGREIVFPRCPSPEPARFDITQAPSVVLSQIEGHGSQSQSPAGGLWSSSPKTASPKSSESKVPSVKGLWGGFCVENTDSPAATGGLAPPTGQTGLMTPRADSTGVNPFEKSFAHPAPTPLPNLGMHALQTPRTPPTPPRSVQDLDMGHIDAVLVSDATLDADIAREFPDAFVTQVYNYLSLGYPSLARPFDAELAKISRLPLAALRSDDEKARQSPRGYIRLGPDFEGGGGQGVTEQECVRWRALKLYVREWARQEKNMVEADATGANWGTTARRGSWAW